MHKPSPSKTAKRLRVTDSQEYQPPSKRARIPKSGKPALVKTTRRSRNVGLKGMLNAKSDVPLTTLCDLPAELLLEIFSHLPTKDLLSLSTLCKALRSILLDGSDSCQMIWKRSRQCELVPIPAPADGISEEKWATFLYGSTCQMCGASGKGVKLIHIYSLRRRVCRTCMTKNVTRGADQPVTFARSLPFASLRVLPLIPSTHKQLGSGPTGHAAAQQFWGPGYYWISDITKMSKLLARDFPEVFFSEKTPEESPEFTKFCETRVAYVEKVMQHSADCCIWEREMTYELNRLKFEEKEKLAKAKASIQSNKPEAETDMSMGDDDEL